MTHILYDKKFILITMDLLNLLKPKSNEAVFPNFVQLPLQHTA
jgi:hypothetical protein